MKAEATLRCQGNSVSIDIPSAILHHFGFSVGQTVSLETTSEGLLIKAKRSTRYTAAELNSQCNPKVPMPPDLQDWENMPDIGSER